MAGVLHCCGGEHADRIALARRAVEVFELDGDLLEVGPPPARATGGEAVPRDTRLDAASTAARLDVKLPDLGQTLGRLKSELESSWSPA
jgi:dTDP-4-dehydrorhamnose reductase